MEPLEIHVLLLCNLQPSIARPVQALASILIIALVAVSTAELPQVDEVVPEDMLVTPEEVLTARRFA